MVWPTARMRKREEMIFRARRREALLVREEFETKMTNLVQAEAPRGAVALEWKGFYYPSYHKHGVIL